MAIPAIRVLPHTALLLGEIHGVRQNIQALDYLVRTLGIHAVCIEVSSGYASDFRLLRMNSCRKLLNKIRKRDPWVFKAGVLSSEHLEYYATLQERGVHVIPVKEEQKVWNQAEKRMAENILKAIKKTKTPCIATVGNYHARKKKFHVPDDNSLYTPLGWLLRDLSVSIQIRYAKGAAFNFHTIQLTDPTVKEKLGTEKLKLLTSRSQYFDYDMLLRKASPVVV